MYTKDINLTSTSPSVEGEYVIKTNSIKIPKGSEYSVNNIYIPIRRPDVLLEDDFIQFQVDELVDDLIYSIQLANGLYKPAGLALEVEKASNALLSAIATDEANTLDAIVSEENEKLNFHFREWHYIRCDDNNCIADGLNYDANTDTWYSEAGRIGFARSPLLPFSYCKVALSPSSPADNVSVSVFNIALVNALVDDYFSLTLDSGSYTYSTYEGDSGTLAVAPLPGDVMSIEWQCEPTGEDISRDLNVIFRITRSNGTEAINQTLVATEWFVSKFRTATAVGSIADSSSSFENFNTFFETKYDSSTKIVLPESTARTLGIVGHPIEQSLYPNSVYEYANSHGKLGTKKISAVYDLPAVLVEIPEFGLKNIDNGFGDTPDFSVNNRSIAISIPRNFVDPDTRTLSYQPPVLWKTIYSATADDLAISQFTVKIYVDGDEPIVSDNRLYIGLTIRSPTPFDF